MRVEGEDGSRSDWSEPLVVLAGHLSEGEWVGQFIGLAEPAAEAQPVLLRRDFAVSEPVRRAILYSTAQGVYDVELNGAAVDDAEMKPGWTAYQHRLLYDVADVTALVRTGDNTLSVDLAGGWFTEKYGFSGQGRAFYGEQPAFAGQLVIEYESGRTEVLATDDTWFATADGPRTTQQHLPGRVVRRAAHAADRAERMDARGRSRSIRRSPAAFERAGAGDRRARRRVDHRDPERQAGASTSGRTSSDGCGSVSPARPEPSSRFVTRRCSSTASWAPDPCASPRRPTATRCAVAGEEVWEPRFTFHGFRYAELEGWPGEFDPAAVTAVVLHSDMKRSGWFETSHPLLNRLHENVVWGMRGNFLSIPSDCPQRDERLGWTGDIQVFAPTASYLYDCDAFLSSWLEDLAADQTRGRRSRALRHPVRAALGADSGGRLGRRRHGRAARAARALRRHRRGACPVREHEGLGRHDRASSPDRTCCGRAASSSGIGWIRMRRADFPAQAKADPGLVATAYFYRSTRLVADAALLLGSPATAGEYRDRADRIRDAFRSAYVTPSGRLLSDAPTAYALALQFELAPVDLRQAMGDRLAGLVRASGYRMSTGFVGTPLIQDALVATGHLATAGRLLQQTQNPSWLYAVTMGATTIWERWDSMLEDGSINPGSMTSFNHYAFGAVADWMHRSLGGIAPAEPGYKRMTIAPHPIEGVEWVTTSHLTPYGRAEVHWTARDGSFALDVTVPANTSAEIQLPDGARHEVGSGTHRFTALLEAPVGAPREVTLDSSLAEIIDDPEALEVLLNALPGVDPDGAEWLGRRTRWVPERTLRDVLLMAPDALVDEVAIRASPD